MKLCRVRKNFKYIDCTYKAKHCTWLANNEYAPWVSREKLNDECLVPIPVQLSTSSVS